jgi:thiamine biosynthesis lipoprotein
MSGEQAAVHRFRHEAMATQFEILIAHEDHEFAAGAALAAFQDIDILEGELSRFQPGSDISRLNAANTGEDVVLGFAATDCLLLARDVSEATAGAFDVTIGPLFRLWRDDRAVAGDALSAARASCGWESLAISTEPPSARKTKVAMEIDLGGIGKGYALDQAAELLREWEVESALLHSGTSTVLALGSAPGSEKTGWPVNAGPEGGDPVWLENQALSGSGFEVQGAHIIDPRTGRPCQSEYGLIWAIAPSAALSDALSTAFMVMKKAEIIELCQSQNGIRPVFLEN